MSPLLLPRRPLLTFTLSGAFLTFLPQRRPLLCDTHSPSTFRTSSSEAKVPVFKNGRPNPLAYRQLSAGSICGVLGGLALSTFSKPLAVVLGLLVFGVQWLVSRGYNPLPTARIQRYVKGMDVRSAVEDNAAFKFAFGVTFGLAAFAEF